MTDMSDETCWASCFVSGLAIPEMGKLRTCSSDQANNVVDQWSLMAIPYFSSRVDD